MISEQTALTAEAMPLRSVLYYLAIEECTNIYIEKNYEKIPKKSKEKVKTKVV